MSIYFSEPKPEPKPSLAQRLCIDGKVKFLKQHGFWISAEDNEPDFINVRIVMA